MQVSAKRRNWISLGFIVLISAAIAFGLIGRQALYANWGIVDDHEIFSFMGTHRHLPIADFFQTLMTKTEVGDPNSPRFRPSYYILTLVEAVTWGRDVHLWYLARTVFFTIFIASLWWLLSKFLRIWLAAALLLPVLALPFWAGIWARLGPSETYGTLALGLLLPGIYLTVESQDAGKRKWGAALVTLAAFILIGSKETFIPLAGAALVVLAFAGFYRRIPVWMAVGFSLAICLYVAAVFFVVQKAVVATGEDFYANKIDPRELLGIAGRALRANTLGNGLALAYAAVIVFFGYCAKRTKRNWSDWIRSSCVIVAIFGFMAAVYFSQQVFYRGQLPVQMRYDFPASLFVPLSCCVLICYVFYQMRFYLDARVVNYFSIFLALIIGATYATRFAVRFNSRPLPLAVTVNIEKTSAFFNEVSALASAARQSPRSPIILEAYGGGALEALFAVQTYVRSLGAENPVSVRLHPAGGSQGVLYDRLERRIGVMENESSPQFVPLSKSLANRDAGCISVGINGPASETCTGFEVKT
jgi:hypothetical protein